MAPGSQSAGLTGTASTTPTALRFTLIAVGSLASAVMGGRWVTVIAFVVTVAGFSLPEKGAALLGVALFATDLVIRARRALRAPGPPI